MFCLGSYKFKFESYIGKYCGTLSRRVCANNKQFPSENELQVAIVREWHNIPETKLKNL